MRPSRSRNAPRARSAPTSGPSNRRTSWCQVPETRRRSISRLVTTSSSPSCAGSPRARWWPTTNVRIRPLPFAHAASRRGQQPGRRRARAIGGLPAGGPLRLARVRSFGRFGRSGTGGHRRRGRPGAGLREAAARRVARAPSRRSPEALPWQETENRQGLSGIGQAIRVHRSKQAANVGSPRPTKVQRAVVKEVWHGRPGQFGIAVREHTDPLRCWCRWMHAAPPHRGRNHRGFR